MLGDKRHNVFGYKPKGASGQAIQVHGQKVGIASIGVYSDRTNQGRIVNFVTRIQWLSEVRVMHCEAEVARAPVRKLQVRMRRETSAAGGDSQLKC